MTVKEDKVKRGDHGGDCDIAEGERDHPLFGNNNTFMYLGKLFFHHYVSTRLWKKGD